MINLYQQVFRYLNILSLLAISDMVEGTLLSGLQFGGPVFKFPPPPPPQIQLLHAL